MKTISISARGSLGEVKLGDKLWIRLNKNLVRYEVVAITGAELKNSVSGITLKRNKIKEN